MFSNVDRTGTHDYKSCSPRNQYNNQDLISLGCADCEIAVAQPIKDAILERATHPVYGYTMYYQEFYDSIIRYYARHHNLVFDVQDLILFPGIVSAVSIVLKSLLQPGDTVCLMHPEYPPFERICKAAGYNIQLMHLKENADLTYEIDFENAESALAGAKVFLFSNPHNPTGNSFSSADLSRLHQICSHNNTVMLCDEIWADLSFADFTPILNVSKQNTVSFLAASKTFNVAGLQLGFAVIKDPELKQTVKIEAESIHCSPNNPIVLAGTQAAFENCDEWLRSFKAFIIDQFTFVQEFIDQKMNKIGVYIPEATYLLWLDFSRIFETVQEAHTFCINNGVYLQSGAEFCEKSGVKLRMNVTSGRDIIEEAMNRLKKGYDMLENVEK
ncbi:Selenocystathionine_beta-lyase / Cystathionine beta-lyase [Hexamita inflata]|uniref:cysteine-S-conjugate beta-lyase n=1 Tax=Hexamita inflata TaxID=28002 RepID=A0AA86RE33_9EUKA|nr:Selenocystathionine beta-lyase / Cystathionine beta-lyase [Hexamita inflata]